MAGATLGVAALGSVFALFGGNSSDLLPGLPPAFLGGAAAEFTGAVLAFMFIRRDSLQRS
jgi:hypothetical protein